MAVVIFDMDGTLSERDHIFEVYSSLGLAEEAGEIYRKYRDEEISHRNLWMQGTELLKGLPRETLKAIASRVPLREGSLECIDELQSRGHDVIVLTDGYAELIQDKVDCPVFGKSIEYRDGCVEKLLDDWITESLMLCDGKSRIVNCFAERYETVVVDDHPERIRHKCNCEVIDPRDFKDLHSVADYIAGNYRPVAVKNDEYVRRCASD